MKPGKGKAKGSAFERQICKQLSLWVSKGKRQDLFWRSAMSGGRTTIAHRKGVDIRQGGDICSVAPEGHALTDKWFVECKHVKHLALDQFLIKGTGPLAKFWKKASKEANRHKKHPMIIARQNRWPVLVVTRRKANASWVVPLILHRQSPETVVSLLSDILAEQFE